MILERAEISIVEGREDEFAALMAERGKPLLSQVEGVRRVMIGRGVENPSKFVFLVEWESVEIHAAWRGTPSNTEFGAMFAGFATGASMEHFRFD